MVKARKKVFNRRFYDSPSAFFRDLGAIIARWRDMRALMRGEIVDGAFRERLMLTVTAVNGCRYCSWAHARQALVTGITGDEVRSLLTGEVGDSPAAELPALLYAQHWAESGGRPEAAVRPACSKRTAKRRCRPLNCLCGRSNGEICPGTRLIISCTGCLLAGWGVMMSRKPE